MYKPFLLLLALAAGACAPLRNTRTEERQTLLLRDSTFDRLLRREADRCTGTLRQIVVEYAPPAAEPASTANPGRTANPVDPVPLAAAPTAAPSAGPITGSTAGSTAGPAASAMAPTSGAPAVRRIIRTELTLQRDRTTATDSLARSRTDTELQQASDRRLRERPSGTAVWLRRGALLALLLTAGLLLRRLRR